MRKLSDAAQKLAYFADRIGVQPLFRDSSGKRAFRLDSRFLRHVLDTRDDVLLDAACLILEQGKGQFHAQ